MITAVWMAGIAAALFALHLLALWKERRGWLYYVKKQGRGGAAGNAFLEIQSLLKPETKHVLQVRREERVARDDEGEPKHPAGSGPAAGPE